VATMIVANTIFKKISDKKDDLGRVTEVDSNEQIQILENKDSDIEFIESI
jgi:hypothetical protein